MSKLQALKKGTLSEASASPGITRHLAYTGGGFLVLHAESVPGVISGWHHHGDYDIYGYVVSGSARLESTSEDSESIIVHPGDFFHVPAHTVHREINPSSEEDNEIILFLQGTGPMVFNVEHP